MVENPVAHLIGEIEAHTAVFQLVHHAQTLTVVRKIRRIAFLQYVFSGMSERRMAEVMSERGGFRQILVERESAGDGARNLRDLQGMRQARAVMVVLRTKEYLRFVHQPPKCLAVDNAVAVALELRARRTRCAQLLTAFRILTETGEFRKKHPFPFTCHLRNGHENLPTVMRHRKHKTPHS